MESQNSSGAFRHFCDKISRQPKITPLGDFVTHLQQSTLGTRDGGEEVFRLGWEGGGGRGAGGRRYLGPGLTRRLGLRRHRSLQLNREPHILSVKQRNTENNISRLDSGGATKPSEIRSEI